MPENDDNHGDPRAEAREALRRGWFHSLTNACKVFVGTVPIAALTATAFYWLQRFSWGVLGGIAASCVSVFFGAFFVSELERLGRCRSALESVLRTDKSYVDLLRDAREERDRAIAERTAGETKIAIQAQLLNQAHVLAILRASAPTTDREQAHVADDPARPRERGE